MTHISSATRWSLSLLAGLLVSLSAAAQTPQVAKTSAATSNSTFLLGSLTAAHTQSLYAPADLAGASAGSIDRLYFQYGSTGQALGNTLTNLVIQLGQTTATTYGGSTTFLTGLTTVLNQASYTIQPGTTGQWFSIDLDNGFAYDPAQTLILDIAFSGTTTTNFGTLGDATSQPQASGKKLYAGNTTATTGDPSSATWQHLGFDLRPLGLPGLAADGTLTLFPNPAQGQVRVQTGQAAPAQVLLRDLTGRAVLRQELPAGALRLGTNLPLEAVAPGGYLLEVRQGPSRTVRRLRVE